MKDWSGRQGQRKNNDNSNTNNNININIINNSNNTDNKKIKTENGKEIKTQRKTECVSSSLV